MRFTASRFWGILLSLGVLFSFPVFADEGSAVVDMGTVVSDEPSATPTPTPSELPSEPAAYEPATDTSSSELPAYKPAAVTSPSELPTSEPAAVTTPSPSPSPVPAPSPARSRRPITSEKTPAEAPKPNLLVEHFYMPPGDKLKYQTTEINGFVFVETPNREKKTRYSIVTDFADHVLKMRAVPGMQKTDEMRNWIKKDLQVADFNSVEIRKLTVPTPNGEPKVLYWVGNKSFETAEQAQAEITMVQSIVEAQGGNFAEQVAQAKTYIREPEKEPAVEIKTPEQFQKEEELALRFLDQLDVGNEIFGPFQGTGSGERVTWQSFGETSWRETNLDKKNFSSQVGFWTNRVVLKGVRFPLSTVDPYIEVTGALESNGVDFASHLDMAAGVEWRPLSRNAFLVNYRPWSLPLLEWARNYRIFFQYMERKNLKDEIAGSRDYDVRWGAQIFYENGIDLPPVSEGPPKGIPDYIRNYMWWEYFGDYHYEWTDFSAQEDFNSVILNSSVIIGFKTPGIPLPHNIVNDELVLMPYIKFEHVNNTEFSLGFQNRYFVAAGCRWMPFRNYRYKENEWLAKTKVFVEYVGVGAVHTVRQGDGDGVPDVSHDLRFGVSFSQRRF